MRTEGEGQVGEGYVFTKSFNKGRGSTYLMTGPMRVSRDTEVSKMYKVPVLLGCAF